MKNVLISDKGWTRDEFSPDEKQRAREIESVIDICCICLLSLSTIPPFTLNLHPISQELIFKEAFNINVLIVHIHNDLIVLSIFYKTVKFNQHSSVL